nr:hypothetical protein [Tanacetum cinerariifolium]
MPRHRFASQVGVLHDLTKPVTPHSWPQFRKSSFAKPYDVNVPGPSRNSPKHVLFQTPRESVGSNDIVHYYYLEEAKKKTQLQKDKALNTKPSVQQFARIPNTANAKKKTQLQKDKALNTKPSVQQFARIPNTANGNKPKPRNFNQQPRNWPLSMSSRVLNRTDNIAESPRQIPIGQIFSQNKSSNVYLKTMPLRSGLTWTPTSIIFIQFGLEWIPIRKSVETRHNTNDSASPLGKKTNNPNTTICANSSSLSA